MTTTVAMTNDTHDLSSDGSNDEFDPANMNYINNEWKTLSVSSDSAPIPFPKGNGSSQVIELSDIIELEKQSERLLLKINKLTKNESTSSTLSTASANSENNFASLSPGSKKETRTLAITGKAEISPIKSSPRNVSNNQTESVNTVSSPGFFNMPNQFQRLDVLSWYRSWKNKKREVKVQALYQSLFPKLRDASNKLRVWLDDVNDKKKNAVTYAMKLYEEMMTAVDLCQNQMDIYDNIFNDCLQIGLDLKKEIVELKISLEFGKEIIQNSHTKKSNGIIDHIYPAHHSHGHHRHHRHHKHRDSAKSSTPTDSDPLQCIPLEPAVWHGYIGQEGKNIHIAKSPGIASLIVVNSQSSNQSGDDSQDFDKIRIPLVKTASVNSAKSSNVSSLFPGDLRKSNSESSFSGRRSLSPEATKKPSFLYHVFSSPESKRMSADSAVGNGSFRQISKLLNRPRSISGSSDTPCNISTSSKSEGSFVRSRSNSSTPCLNSTLLNKMNSIAISSSTSSLNSLLVEFNTNACTVELDNLFTESTKLLENSNDSVIEDILARMKLLRGVKESIGKLILDVKLAREEAVSNKKRCRQIRDDLEILITSQLKESVKASQMKQTSPSTSPECGSLDLAEQLPDSKSYSSLRPPSIDVPASTYLSDKTFSVTDPHSPTGTSDGRMSPHHHDIYFLDDHSMSTNAKRLSITSNESHVSDGLFNDSVKSDRVQVTELTSQVASRFIGDLKSILEEEELVKQKLAVVEHLCQSTSSHFRD